MNTGAMPVTQNDLDSVWTEVNRRAGQLGYQPMQQSQTNFPRQTNFQNMQNITQEQLEQISDILSGTQISKRRSHKSSYGGQSSGRQQSGKRNRGSFQGSQGNSSFDANKILRQNESYRNTINHLNMVVNTLTLALAGEIEVPASLSKFSSGR